MRFLIWLVLVGQAVGHSPCTPLTDKETYVCASEGKCEKLGPPHCEKLQDFTTCEKSCKADHTARNWVIAIAVMALVILAYNYYVLRQDTAFLRDSSASTWSLGLQQDMHVDRSLSKQDTAATNTPSLHLDRCTQRS